MYLRVGRKIVNSDNPEDADVYEPGEGLSPHRAGRAEARTVVVTTTALETLASPDGTLGARRLSLSGGDADLFLEALPVYRTVPEP